MTATTIATDNIPFSVDTFLRCLATGDWDDMGARLTEDAVYDASVPGWRYQYRGAARVVQEYREEWSGKYRWNLVECHVVRDAESVALLVEMHGDSIRPGAHPPVVCRLSNFFRIEGDRIAEHRFTCCGEWGPETVQHIATHAATIEGAT